MAGLGGDNVGLLLRIKADSTDAVKDLNKVQSEIKGVGTAGTTAASGLGAMVNPAALVAVGIAAVGAAVAAAAVGIFNLTKSTSEFGSALFDAQAKTGLSAETLSTLKVNADKAGSSFEQVTGSVSKFTVLLGQAQQGNEKANETLNKYGVTARDTTTALDQAITTIAAMETVEQRAAAARELFKDRTLAFLPIIEQLNGSLSEATKETIRTGQAMTDEGIRAADDFGDALVDLNAQAAATGRQFATAMMPMITGAMKSVSQAMADNKDRVAEWGQNIADTMRGTVIAVQRGHDLIKAAIVGISTTFGANKNSADGWANNLLANIGRLVNRFNVLYLIMERIRSLGAAARPIAGLGGEFDPNAGGGGINLGGGGGKGGGGGSGKAPQDTSVADAQRRDQYALDLFKESTKAQIIENDKKLAAMEITERQHLDAVYSLKIAELEKEETLLKAQLNLAKLDAKEREEIQHRLDVIRSVFHTKEVENSKEITLLKIKGIEEEAKLKLDAAKLAKEEHERELERIEKERKAKNERDNKQANANEEADREKLRRKAERRDGATLTGGGFAGGLLGSMEIMKGIGLLGTASQIAGDKANAAAYGIAASWGMMKDSIMGGVDAMVQGLGSMVEAWVLYGSAGPQAMKKMVASVLAGVAAQSAVLAIFELAKGFAALWLNPKEAADHFIAAALFGSIATGAALGGRAVAGDSFSQSTANGGAGGANNTQGDGSPQRDPNTFSSGQFGGFGSNGNQQNSGVIGRLNETLVVLEDTVHGLKTRIAAFSPGQVLGMGAEQNPNAISDSLLSGLSDNPRLTGGFKRAFGDAR